MPQVATGKRPVKRNNVCEFRRGHMHVLRYRSPANKKSVQKRVLSTCGLIVSVLLLGSLRPRYLSFVPCSFRRR